MQRISEPTELMSDPEQAYAYASGDFAVPHQMFVDLFRERFPGHAVDGRVLDLGCGPADVTIRFARAYPRCRIDGIDGSAAMLSLGRQAVRDAGLQGRITLLEGILPQVELSRERYDVLISNSLLHHLLDPSVLWRTARDHVRGAGLLFAMDLMRPTSRAEAEALQQIYCSNEPEVLRQDFLNSLYASYRQDEVRAQLDALGLTGLHVEIPTDRHLIVWGSMGPQ